MTLPQEHSALCERILTKCRGKQILIATAESCTGGMIAAALTDIAGSSDVFDRGFVTYSNEAKSDMLGIDPELITRQGAVSEDVARAMALGALSHSRARLSVSVTGVAGPGGGTATKPVGTVHIAVARDREVVIHEKCAFADNGRAGIRLATTQRALALLEAVLDDQDPAAPTR